jgi:hypothetical protein
MLNKFRKTALVLFLGSLPFKGRARVGMGFGRAATFTIYPNETHPHPNLPLDGEGVKPQDS